MNLIEIKVAQIDQLQSDIDAYSEAIAELAKQLTHALGMSITSDNLAFIKDNIAAQKLLRNDRDSLLKQQVSILDSIVKL